MEAHCGETSVTVKDRIVVIVIDHAGDLRLVVADTEEEHQRQTRRRLCPTYCRIPRSPRPRDTHDTA